MPEYHIEVYLRDPYFVSDAWLRNLSGASPFSSDFFADRIIRKAKLDRVAQVVRIDTGDIDPKEKEALIAGLFAIQGADKISAVSAEMQT